MNAKLIMVAVTRDALTRLAVFGVIVLEVFCTIPLQADA